MENSQASVKSTLVIQPAKILSPLLSPDTPIDPELRNVIDAWPRLPADVRKMILGVVKATMEAAKRPK